MIRRARPEDVDGITLVEQDVFSRDRKSKLLKRTAKTIEQFPDGCLVDVSSKGEIRGFIKCTLQDERDPHEFEKCVGDDYAVLYLTFIGVSTKHQGKGIGRRLLQEMRRRHGLPSYLVVESLKGRAAGLYRSEGFRFRERVPRHISDEKGKRHYGYLMTAPALVA